MNKLLIIAFSFMLLFSSCTEENDINNITSISSVKVFNEGNFGSADATIGTYQMEDSSYYPAQFRSKNGYFIGDVLQSVTKVKDDYYVVLSGSNAIEHIDSEFTSIESLKNDSIDKPQYMVVDGDLAYLSVWGPYNTDYSLSNSKVLKIDLSTMEVIKSIDTEAGVEQLLKVGNRLLVVRNYFNTYHHLTIINTETEEVLNDIELPNGPTELMTTTTNEVWVACTSGFLAGVNLDNNSITTIDLEGEIFGDVELIGEDVYYFQSGTVNKVNLNTGVSQRIFEVGEVSLTYSFGVHPQSLDVFIGDAIDYGVEGKVLHFQENGQLVSEFSVGIFPTQFIF